MMSGEADVVQTEHGEVVKPHLIFSGTPCESLFYRFRLKKEGFDVESFAKAVGIPDDKRDKRSTITCAPLNQESDYHLHVSWRFRNMVNINIDFIRGAVPPEKNEREPFAEQFMSWIEPFFLDKSPAAEIHGDFTYSSAKWEPRFSLPLKANVGPNDSEAEIDGISFKVMLRPEGISKIWLTTENSNIMLHMAAERLSDMRVFDVHRDIAMFTGVLNTVLKEKRQ